MIGIFTAVRYGAKAESLPEGVVVGVMEEVLPGGKFVVEIALVGVGERAEAKVEIEGIGAVEFEVGVGGGAGFEQGGVLEAIAQAKRSVVVKVVAQELVGGRGLFDGGFERGVGIEGGHHGGPSAVGGAGNARAPVVVGDVLDEPVDGVPGVGGFVDAFGIGGIVRRASHDELAFGFEAAADVLVDVVVVFPALAPVGRHAFGDRFPIDHAVRSALDEKGKRSFRILRGKDDGLEADAVAHGNHDFLEIELDAGFFGLSGEEQRGSKGDGGEDSHRSPSICLNAELVDPMRLVVGAAVRTIVNSKWLSCEQRPHSTRRPPLPRRSETPDVRPEPILDRRGVLRHESLQRCHFRVASDLGLALIVIRLRQDLAACSRDCHRL